MNRYVKFVSPLYVLAVTGPLDACNRQQQEAGGNDTGLSDAVPMVRGPNKHSKAENRTCLVVKKDSPIKSMSDLHNVRFAFGSATSTSTRGHLIPRIRLSTHKIALTDLARYFYTGSHQKCADSNLSGKTDVCGMQNVMADEPAGLGLQKIPDFSGHFPSRGIVASSKLPLKVRTAVQKALLKFDPTGIHAKELYCRDKTETPNDFLEAHDMDYMALRMWMKKLNYSENEACFSGTLSNTI